MEYAKITIKPNSPFISEFQSDTIFGHFAWGVRFLYGEDRLKELLSDFEDNPFIIFSDGFLKGYLPKPFLKPKSLDCSEIEDAKRVKKISLVKKEFIFENIDSLNDDKLFEYLKNQQIDLNSKTHITQKNSVNRDTSIVTEGLYAIKEKFIDNEYEIYFAYQRISQDEIIEVFNFIAKRGYGKDKSAGKGKFKFQIDWDFKEKKYFKRQKDSNKYLNLSTMFYNKDRMKLYFGKSITKFPKTGGYYASSEPFKNPCMMYVSGSTFIVGDGILGKAESSVYNKQNHFQNGYSVGIYFDGE